MESNEPAGLMEVHINQQVDGNDNDSEVIKSSKPQFLALEMSEMPDENGSGTISKCRTALSMEQLIVQGKLNDLMKTVDYLQLDGRSQNGFTMLHYAAKVNRPDIIEFLVNSGCDINPEDDAEQTPLHKAAISGAIESVQFLLKEGAQVDKIDINNHTPLHNAIISGGDIEIVRALATKADLRIQEGDGQNVLHLAVRYHKIDCIDLILNHTQASELTAATSNCGCTPLHLAVSLGHLDTLERLLQGQKPDLFKTTNQGKTLLHLAAAASNGAVLRFLLDLQGTLSLVNKPDHNLGTPLHDAALNGHMNQVTLLMDRGAIFSSTKTGFSPLHYACKNGHLSVVKNLLHRHSFQMHYVTRNGDTALHVAARNGHAAIVKLLLDSGISITHNAQQASFFDIALFNRDSKVASEAVKSDRWQECLDMVSPIHPAPMITLVHTLPDVAKMVMDKCIHSPPLYSTDAKYRKRYDFKYLLDEPKNKPADEHKCQNGTLQLIWYYIYCIFVISDDKKINTFKVIKAMLEHDRKALLIHPLLLTFLNLKWQNYGRRIIKIRAAPLLILTFLLTVSLFTCDPPRPSIIQSVTNISSTSNETDINAETDFHNNRSQSALEIVILIINFVYMIVAIFPVVMSIRLRSFSQLRLLLAELGTVTFTALFIMQYPTPWLAAVAALLCAWFAIHLFSRYFDVFGLYTIMFYDLLYSIVRAILVCLYYIIGFGLIMYIIIGEETLYSSPWIAVYTTFFSVINGFDIQILERKHSDGTLQYSTTSYIIVLIMTVILSITLLNLLIGISVGNIDNIRKNALLYQAKLKIHLFLELDPNIPISWKEKIIPKDHTVKGSIDDLKSVFAYVWNYISSFFAPHVECEDSTEENLNEDNIKLEDMSYRIKQIESQIEILLKHQKVLLSELRK